MRPAALESHREIARQSDRLDSRQGSEPLAEFAVENLPGLLVVAVHANAQAAQQHPVGPESQVRHLGAPQAFDAEAGADQQGEGQRHFRDRQQTAQPLMPPASPGAAAAFFQGRGEVGPGGLQRGDQSEHHACDRDDAEGEQQRRAVDGERETERKVAHWKRSDQDVDGPEREQDAKCAAGGRQQEAFGEKLADQAGAGGAERQADGDLPLAHRGAREQQAGEIGGHDE